MTYPDAKKPAGIVDRSRLGDLLLCVLMLALPALAALPASARDKPERIQERVEERQVQTPPTHQSSAPAQEAPPSVQEESPPESEASPPEREPSPPEREPSPPVHESAAPARPSAPQRNLRIDRTERDRSTRPDDTNAIDPWGGRDWAGTDDVSDSDSSDRDLDGPRDDHRERENGGSNYDRDRNHHHDHPIRHCSSWRYGGFYGRGDCFPWNWPWWPTLEVASDHSANEGWGALDLDVSPERAEIYLDGQQVGIADDYDGFPTYLWLERGIYDLAIYLEGYETVFRRVSIFPGVVMDIEDKLHSGKSIHPDDYDYGPVSIARRDARLERNASNEAAARAPEERTQEMWPSDDPVSRAHIGRLYISVLPPDAAVYLDGHFLGTASEVGQLSAGLVVEPGDHVIELLRPGYENHREEIAVPPGERAVVELELELERD